jgi:hypothetical protein
VGITERAVIRIIVEKHLRHPLEAHHSIKAILALARK